MHNTPRLAFERAIGALRTIEPASDRVRSPLPIPSPIPGRRQSGLRARSARGPRVGSHRAPTANPAPIATAYSSPTAASAGAASTIWEIDSAMKARRSASRLPSSETISTLVSGRNVRSDAFR